MPEWVNAILNIGEIGADFLLIPTGWLAILLLQIANLFAYLGGMILNLTVQYTVLEMANFVNNYDTVNDAWSAIRDIGNMGFIFILLYAAIKTIVGFGSDTQKLIRNVIIVAILINFSLFFTKVVIDISNVLAIYLYDAIAPGALSNTLSVGISNSIMGRLFLTSLFDLEGLGLALEGKRQIMIGVLGSILSMIAAFVFFAIAIMLIIRFVVLLFVLILSPLAFLGSILPGTSGLRNQWWNALLGQAFFAPIFFLMAWIVIVVTGGLFEGTGGGATFVGAITGRVGPGGEVVPPGEAEIRLFINFIVAIVFLIASLTMSKQLANKAGPAVTGATKWALGAAGTATFGAAAFAGRSTIGSGAAKMAADEGLKQRAAEGSIRARLQLAAANKVAKSSFDIRGTGGLGSTLGAGTPKKNASFSEDQKRRAKGYEKYKPTPEVRKEVKARETGAQYDLSRAKTRAENTAQTAVSKHPELVQAEEALDTAQRGGDQDTIRTAQERVNVETAKYNKAKQQFVKSETRVERDTLAGAIKSGREVERRMENFAKRMEEQRKLWGIPIPDGFVVKGRDKAKAIRAAAKGKTKAEQIVEDAEKKAREEIDSETPEAPPTPPPTPPPPTGGGQTT